MWPFCFGVEQIVAQHNARSLHKSKVANKNLNWKMSQENIPTISDTYVRSNVPLELMNQTKDTSDYLWYITR